MADYNVQMKQYNGTSFDNILPYASQALTLAGGGGATEIIAQARAGLSQIATGSYVGNGNFTIPTKIIVGFNPKVLFMSKGVSVNPGNYNFINGTRMNWSAFNASIEDVLSDGGTWKNENVFSGALNVDGTPTLLSYGSYNDTDTYLMIKLTENNGIVSIEQSYYAAASFSNYTPSDIRTARNQFNEQGKRYYWVAFA